MLVEIFSISQYQFWTSFFHICSIISICCRPVTDRFLDSSPTVLDEPYPHVNSHLMILSFMRSNLIINKIDMPLMNIAIEKLVTSCNYRVSIICSIDILSVTESRKKATQPDLVGIFSFILSRLLFMLYRRLNTSSDKESTNS